MMGVGGGERERGKAVITAATLDKMQQKHSLNTAVHSTAQSSA